MSAPTDPATPNPYAPPRDESAQAMVLPNNAAIEALFEAGESGAGWFYWVAGLSLINSIGMLSGANFRFSLGLGVTLIADTMATEAVMAGGAESIKLLALGFDVVVLALVVACGWLSRKRVLPVFAIGMVLYLLDGLIFVLFFNVISIAIHAFALWQMWNGFMAFRQLNRLEQQMAAMASGGP
jgi:hypothetical protein